MNYATLSFVDGRIRFYPDSGLPSEEYTLITKTWGFKWYRGEGAFVALYTPSREDYLGQTYQVELEEEDAQEREMARDARESDKLDRFNKYGKNAAKRSKQAYDESDRMASFIPMGQPILVGHHSEGRDRNYRARIWAKMGKSVEESKKAEYWERRAQSTLNRQQQRENPGVIYRRIEGLEADLRKCHREIERKQSVDFYTRFVTFYEGRLAYERALYLASGGVPADSKNLLDKLEKGGWVEGRWGTGEILRINKGHNGKIKSVSIPYGIRDLTYQVKVDKILRVWTKEEADALRAQRAAATEEPKAE